MEATRNSLSISESPNPVPRRHTVQASPLDALQNLFNEAININSPLEEQQSSFNSLLCCCPIDSEVISHLQSIGGDTLLTHAVKNWDNERVERLKQYPNLCLQKDAEENTPLHIAAKNGACDSFFSLLSVLPLQQKNLAGQTAVHTAIANGQSAIISELIKRGGVKADSFMITLDGFSLNLLAYALMQSQKEVCQVLLETGLFSKEHWVVGLGNPLHMAAYYGLPDVCSYLSSAEPILFKQWSDQVNEAGQTPLHVAATNGKTELIQMLYERAPRSLETADNEGHRPIYAAAFAKKPACVELLVALGCKAEYYKSTLGSLRAQSNPDANLMISFMENLLPQLENPSRRQQYSNRPVNWVALAGGGAKGPGEIGALLELKRLGCVFQGISGTSIGAIMATLTAVGYSPEELEKEFVEKAFEDFLDHPLKNKKIADLLKTTPSLGTLLTSVRELTKFATSPLKYGLDKGRQLVNSLVHVKGLCKGEALRIWIEELIQKKTGVSYLTFGELAEKKLGHLPNLQTTHLFVSITSIKGDSQELVCMNTFDPEWKNHIISDGARSSAGYPGAFKPHAEYIKAGNERLKIEGSMHVDGGMLSNGGTKPLDEVRFTKQKEGLEGRRPEFNREVVAFSFLSPTEAPKALKENPTVLDLIKGLMDTYMNAETILNANPYYETRAIKIPVKVGTISYPTIEQKREMITSGQQATKTFFTKREREYAAVQNFVSLLSPVQRKLLESKHSISPTPAEFSGRASHLKHIEDYLKIADWQRGQQVKELLLYGSEGMGKSTLTTAFANKHLDLKLIWEINCHDPEVYFNSYEMLAKALNIPLEGQEPVGRIVRKVHQTLEALNDPWLLIFDDIQNLPEKPKRGGFLLLTSRNKLQDSFSGESKHVESFELSDIEDLITKTLGKADRELAIELAKIFKSHPSEIEQAIRRINLSSLTPKEYLETARNTVKVDQSMLDLNAQAPEAFLFLEQLCYLQEVPEAFLDEWAKNHAVDISAEEIRQQLLSRSMIRYNNQILTIRGATAQQLNTYYQDKNLNQKHFNKAFETLQKWVVQDPLNRGHACGQCLFLAKEAAPDLWEECPSDLKSSIARIAGNWLWAQGHSAEKAISLLDLAMVSSTDTATKQAISLESGLAKALDLHPRLPDLLNFTIYLSELSKPFLKDWLKVSPDEADRIFKTLVDSSILRQSGRSLMIRTDARRILLENQGGIQSNQLNKALAAYSNWLSGSTFNLQTDGAGCVSITRNLEENEEFAALWRQMPIELRAELYLRSAQWMDQVGEDLERAEELYKKGVKLYPENSQDPRKRAIQSELRKLLQRQIKSLQK